MPKQFTVQQNAVEIDLNMLAASLVMGSLVKTHFPQCRIYANRVNNVSDNGLSPIRRLVIICTNAGLSFGPLRAYFSDIFILIWQFFFHKNSSENIFCIMAAILSRGGGMN